MLKRAPGIDCYCNFCGRPLRFQISRTGETVNCFECGMETVLFIPGMQPPYPAERYTVETKDIQWSRTQFGIRTLEGVAENKSRKHLDWVRVEFVLYDKSGTPIGTTSDCMTNAPPGKMWKLQAQVTQADAVQASEPLISCEYGRISQPTGECRVENVRA